MPRMVLTDRYVRSRKPALPGKRDDHFDALVPGLALRVTPAGHKSFILLARFPARPKNTTRRSLGDYGAITLEDARKKARAWLEMIGKGLDPKVAEERRRAEAHTKRTNSFAFVAKTYLEQSGAKLRHYGEAKRVLDVEFIARWGHRPVTEIESGEIGKAIRAIVDRGTPYQAHNAFALIRRMYNWAIGTDQFGIVASPVARLKPKDLIGKREPRERVLTDEELRAVWRACAQMHYPYGPLIKLMILTGQREREVAGASWPEMDLSPRQNLYTIPGARMKNGRTHAVPLANDALSIIQSLPRFASGQFLFTTTGGIKPVNGFSKAKARLDKFSGVKDWKLHDLRRTMRTHLSALPVQDLVRELVIAHARPGLHKVYDQHSYLDEKRECLELWEDRLTSIVKAEP